MADATNPLGRLVERHRQRRLEKQRQLRAQRTEHDPNRTIEKLAQSAMTDYKHPTNLPSGDVPEHWPIRGLR